MFALPFVLFFASIPTSMYELGRIVLPFAVPPFWVPAGVLWNRARRLEIKMRPIADAEAIARPVLYLRPFSSDGDAAARNDRMNLWDTGEQSLSRIFSEGSRFVAISRSDGGLAPLGANRFYLADGEDWKPTVRELIREASLIILRPASTDGVTWEIEAIADQQALQKTVLFLPPGEMNLVAYRSILEMVGRRLSARIPEEAASSAFIAFSADNSAIYEPRFRVFYMQGTLAHDVALFSAIFRRAPGVTFSHYMRWMVHMHAAVFYRAELLHLLRGRSIELDPIPLSRMERLLILTAAACSVALVMAVLIGATR